MVVQTVVQDGPALNGKDEPLVVADSWGYGGVALSVERLLTPFILRFSVSIQDRAADS